MLEEADELLTDGMRFHGGARAVTADDDEEDEAD